ncbi:MAG: KWG repeat-containing protein [Bacteroidetes bacterium]|nr:MAG: KWG repeat-containing protein [Bacteroidota bacterium]
MRKSSAILFFILCFSPVFVFGGKLEKGYEALRIFDYFRARAVFESVYDRHPLGAAYGLSLLHSRNDNPFFSLTRAHNQVLQAVSFLQKTGKKEKDRLHKLGVSDSAVYALKKRIETEAYELALGADEFEDWNLFIAEYGDAPQRNAAVERRNEIAFRKTGETNTWQAYKAYCEAYPESKRVEESRALYEQLLYKSLTAANTIPAFENFIAKYSQSPYYSAAEDGLFRLATEGRSVAAFHAFVKKYPGNRNVPVAWNSIYTLYTSDYTPDKIAQFHLDFPDFPDKETIGLDMRLSVTSFYPVRENGKSGFIDSSGTVMIPCVYEWVDDFSEGLAAAGKNDKAGFISKSGKIVVPFEYDEVEPFRKGFAMVKRGDFYGLIDKTGTLILPVMYDEIYEFFESRAVVVKKGKYGFVDRSGEEVIPPQFEKAGDFAGGLAYVVKDGKYGFISREGKMIVEPKYDWVENFQSGVCRVKQDALFGLLGRDSLLLPCAYEYIGGFSEGLALAARGGACGFINRKGQTVIPFDYEFRTQLTQDGGFRNSRARMYRKSKCGFIDTAGKILLPFDYDDAQYPSANLTAVKRKDKWGFADEKLKMKIDYQFEQVFPFAGGRARVKKDGLYGFISTSGKFTVPAEYEESTDADKGRITVKKNGKAGLIDPDNNVILPCVYEKIEFISATTVYLERQSKWAYFHLGRCEFVWKEEGFESGF